jgi:hypothetical protein
MTPKGAPIETDGSAFRDAITLVPLPIDQGRLRVKNPFRKFSDYFLDVEYLKSAVDAAPSPPATLGAPQEPQVPSRPAKPLAVSPEKPQAASDAPRRGRKSTVSPEVREKAQAMADDGASLPTIAEKLDVSKFALIRAGIKSKRVGCVPPQDEPMTLNDQIQTLASFGNTKTAIARQLGISRRTVQRHLRLNRCDTGAK